LKLEERATGGADDEPCSVPSGQMVPQNECQYTAAMESVPASRMTELTAVRGRAGS
jgi:hypothetical protein